MQYKILVLSKIILSGARKKKKNIFRYILKNGKEFGEDH